MKVFSPVTTALRSSMFMFFKLSLRAREMLSWVITVWPNSSWGGGGVPPFCVAAMAIKEGVLSSKNSMCFVFKKETAPQSSLF